jgi:hypothetical protein
MTNRTPRKVGNAALTLALAAAITVTLPLAAFASGGDNGITKTVDGLSLELVVGSGAPRTGSNAVRLEVRDGQSQPVAGAAVVLTVAMDTKASMSMDMDKEKPKTVRLEESTQTPGSYRGNVDLGYSGAWTVSMELKRGDATTMTDFALNVASAGPNWAIIGAFGGIVIVLIIAAAVLRSRKGKAQPAAGGAA